MYVVDPPDACNTAYASDGLDPDEARRGRAEGCRATRRRAQSRPALVLFVPHECLMKPLGRCLQLTSLVVLPVAMMLQIADGISVKQMLTIWVAGASVFWIGRIIEGYAGV